MPKINAFTRQQAVECEQIETGLGAHHELVPHLEDLLEIGRHGLSLVSESAVRANADAVLARHGQDGGAIVLQDRLLPQHMIDGASRLVEEHISRG